MLIEQALHKVLGMCLGIFDSLFSLMLCSGSCVIKMLDYWLEGGEIEPWPLTLINSIVLKCDQFKSGQEHLLNVVNVAWV